jgi:hypothetical protein
MGEEKVIRKVKEGFCLKQHIFTNGLWKHNTVKMLSRLDQANLINPF